MQGIIKVFQAIRPTLYYKFKQLKDFRNFLSREVAHRKRTRILYFLIPREHRRKFITKSHPLQKHRRTFKISHLPNNTGVESEFLIPQEEIPYKNTGEDSQFLILQITQERIQNFWPQNNTGDSDFLIPQTTQERIQNFWSPKQRRRFKIFDPQTIQEGIQQEGIEPLIIRIYSWYQNFW